MNIQNISTDIYLRKKNFHGLSYLYQIRAKSYDHVWPDPYLPIKDYLPILLHGIYKEIGENIGKTCSAVHFRLTIGWNNFSKRIIILLPKLFWPTVREKCSSDRENFWNSRLKVKNLQKILDHWNNFFKQWKVRTIFGDRTLF